MQYYEKLYRKCQTIRRKHQSYAITYRTTTLISVAKKLSTILRTTAYKIRYTIIETKETVSQARIRQTSSLYKLQSTVKSADYIIAYSRFRLRNIARRGELSIRLIRDQHYYEYTARSLQQIEPIILTKLALYCLISVSRTVTAKNDLQLIYFYSYNIEQFQPLALKLCLPRQIIESSEVSSSNTILLMILRVSRMLSDQYLI